MLLVVWSVISNRREPNALTNICSESLPHLAEPVGHKGSGPCEKRIVLLQFIQKRLHISGGCIRVVQSKHHGFPCHFGFVPVFQIGTRTKSQQDTDQGAYGTPDRVLQKSLSKNCFIAGCLFI